jgi:hypothetical protein
MLVALLIETTTHGHLVLQLPPAINILAYIVSSVRCSVKVVAM